MDYPLLIYTVVMFAVACCCGRREYQRLTWLWPDANLTNFHTKPGWVRFLLLLLVILMVPSLYCVVYRAAVWQIPEWLDLSMLWLSNGLGAILFGLLLGLARAAWKKEHLPRARTLVMTVLLCQAGLLFNTVWNQRYVAGQLSNAKWSGQMLMQTSGSSCAAASGANVASVFGLRYSEQEMARFMGTRFDGTSTAYIIRGLRKAGIEARKFDNPTADPAAIPIPAILFVDHPGSGPESHAISALKYHPDTKSVEIWDPLKGQEMMTQADLKQIWSGHGVTCHLITAR